MVNKAAQLTIEQLKAEIIRQYSDTVTNDLVFAALLSALEKKLPEAEYVAFLDSIG
jgi:hypothetical protein